MDTQYLEAFDAIVRYGSFSKAARVLNVSQPTMSGRIQALEDEVGGELFKRGGRHILLTERGASFLPYAQKSLTLLKSGIETAQLVQQGERGQISLGILQSFTEGFLATTVGRYQARYPQVDLFLRTGHTEHIVEMIHDKQIKVGLIAWPFFDPSLIVLQRFEEPLLAVAHAHHRCSENKSVKTQDLHDNGDPFFHITWNDEVSHWQMQSFVKQERVIHLPVSMVHYFLLQGKGVALLPQNMVQNDLKSGRLIALTVEDAPSFIHESALVGLAQERENELPRALHRFLQLLKEDAGASCIYSVI